ncbi:protein HIRA homolog [Coccinella septempunctata]|uniref:protein HIRA homolog n=1 Tax=Coccinella septempunctata TaxID=41139 RepID=UPI001D079153|nr:protein HIRA homolog [Coccinella septempunctata]
MIFFKPVWVTHEDKKPIFSIDIHPNGNRFATGGQGESGGKVVIWNVAPLIAEDAEVDPNVPKILCQMDNHLACVNVVRWSNEGHLLASGGDDKLVMIWRLTNEGVSTVFGSGKINIETWKCIYTLNAHQGDILDLSWAPHDGWLASGSVDNTVIVWNAAKFPEKVAVLKEHTGMVKGITWDPVGKYLASQSDDKSIRVWRTGEWKEEVAVTDPFVDCSATTHVLRLSWSPDGQYLVSAHAMNGGGPTAQIIERDGWRHDKDFVGHRKAVTCVRFNSSIFKKTSVDSPKIQQYCCCAIGSRDRSVSVWLTSLKRPLVVVKELFKDSVLDISWSSNRPLLLACSWDGSVACFIFDETEIGTPLSNSEKNSLYEKLYHKSSWNLGFTGTQIAENPEILSGADEAQTSSKTKTFPKDTEIPATEPLKETSFEVETPKVNPNTTVFVPVNKQVETRLPSGKRRITPMLLTPSVPNTSKDSELTIEIPMYETGTFSSSSPKKSKIVVETLKESPKQQITKPTLPQQHSQIVLQAPGNQIKQLICCEVPGDEPVTQVINILDSHKIPVGTAVLKNSVNQKVQITNKCHKTSKGFLSKIETFKAQKDKKIQWETFLGSVIRCAAVNRKMVVACCEDSSINTYDIKSGARVLPSLLLEDSVSALSLSQDCYCLVLTKTGLVNMWNFTDGKSILSRISVRSLLTNKVVVSGFSLSPNNIPVITLSDGRAYSYLIELQTWVVLSNPSDPLNYAGNSLSRTLPPNLPLVSLQKHMPNHNSNDNYPPGVTLSFLESQVISCKMLDSPIEYKHWLMNLVNHVLEKGPEIRLRSILDKLMMECSSKNINEAGQKKTLLMDIMNVIKSKLLWQRLHKEYMEQILMNNI